MSQVTCDPV